MPWLGHRHALLGNKRTLICQFFLILPPFSRNKIRPTTLHSQLNLDHFEKSIENIRHCAAAHHFCRSRTSPTQSRPLPAQIRTRALSFRLPAGFQRDELYREDVGKLPEHPFGRTATTASPTPETFMSTIWRPSKRLGSPWASSAANDWGAISTCVSFPH